MARPAAVRPAITSSTMITTIAATIGNHSLRSQRSENYPTRQPRRPKKYRGGDSLTVMRARDTDWEGVRLHVVTGKGGTGKTTVAAALALALAYDGRKCS